MNAPTLIPRFLSRARSVDRRIAIPQWIERNRTVVLFLLGMVALDLLVGRFQTLWEGHSPDDYSGRVRACRERRQDFVLVGGSPVAEGLNPSVICKGPDRVGFNLGMPGGTTSDFYHALIHACPEAPRVVVYGITASDVNDSRGEPHGPNSLMTWGDLLGWMQLRPEASEWAVRHFLRGRFERMSSLFHYRHAIRMWAAIEANRLIAGCAPQTLQEAEEQRDYAAGLISGQGYSPMKGFENAHFSEFKKIGAKGTRFDHLHYLHNYRTGSHLKYLSKIIEWCTEKGATLILLDMPVTADLERLYPREFSEYRSQLNTIEREHRIRVLKPSREELGLGDEQFADLIHMNRDGAQRLSGWLSTQLEWGPR